MKKHRSKDKEGMDNNIEVLLTHKNSVRFQIASDLFLSYIAAYPKQ